MFFHSIQGHTFTLSGSCQAFRKGESYRDCGCQRFHKMTEEERFIKASQSWGGTQSLRDFVESLPKGEYLLRHTRSTYPDLAWYRQFDRPQSAGRPEVM